MFCILKYYFHLSYVSSLFAQVFHVVKKIQHLYVDMPRHTFIYPIISELKNKKVVAIPKYICQTLNTDMLAHSRGNLIKVNRYYMSI